VHPPCDPHECSDPYEVTNNKARPFRSTAEKYYEEETKIALNQPLGLLRVRRAHKDHVTSLPSVRNILTQSEPRRVKSTKHVFLGGQRRYGTRNGSGRVILVLFWQLSVALEKIGIKKPQTPLAREYSQGENIDNILI
jgi:hypothetical protein